MIGVTGGTGFVGQRLVTRLANHSPVRVLAHEARQAPLLGVEYAMGDLISPAAVNELVRGCSAVIHLAGIAHSSLRTKAEKEHSHTINVEGTRAILNAALRNGVQRFVFVSTAHVYANHQGMNLEEHSPLHAASFYAETKIEAEELVREAGKTGMEVVIVRPCLIYGPGARFNLHSMMRGIDGRYYFHIAGEKPMRSFLSVENAARALTHLVRSKVDAGTYNLADKSPYSLVDFANELAVRMKRSRPFTVPSSIVRAAGVVGSAIQKLGTGFPVSSEAVAKLTTSFTISTLRLEQTGFEWDEKCGAVRQQMVDHYLFSKQAFR